MLLGVIDCCQDSMAKSRPFWGRPSTNLVPLLTPLTEKAAGTSALEPMYPGVWKTSIKWEEGEFPLSLHLVLLSTDITALDPVLVVF